MKLHPYQEESVARILSDRRHIVGHQMGTGKTACAIEAMKRSGAESILVACPAVARKNWEKQLDEWWPEHPEIQILNTRAAASSFNPAGKISVTSYSLMPYMHSNVTGLDTVVLDEIHLLQGIESKRYLAVEEILDSNGSAQYVGLTGTPFTNKIQAFWSLGNLFWPERYGSRYAFNSRYMEFDDNGYGRHFFGCNAVYLEELRHRISAVLTRADPDALAGLLPPFPVTTAFYKTTSETLDHALSNYQQGASHQVFFFYRRQSVADFVEALNKKRGLKNVMVRGITGAIPPDKRHGVLDECRAAQSSIVVATADSVGISIPLNWFDAATILEFPPRLAALSQLLGRVHRLDGFVPLTIMMPEDGDAVADMLCDRVEAISKVIAGGTFEDAIQSMTKEIRDGGLTADEIRQELAGLLS